MKEKQKKIKANERGKTRVRLRAEVCGVNIKITKVGSVGRTGDFQASGMKE